jgi:hypothetical protein
MDPHGRLRENQARRPEEGREDSKADLPLRGRVRLPAMRLRHLLRRRWFHALLLPISASAIDRETVVFRLTTETDPTIRRSREQSLLTPSANEARADAEIPLSIGRINA